MPNGPVRALPLRDPDEYDRYVFGNDFEPSGPAYGDDDDMLQNLWWVGSYPKYVVAENTVCHTFRNGPSADRVRDRRCVICLENFRDGDELRVLRCFHSFHRNCVDQWLDTSRLCPICKQDITGSPLSPGSPIWATATEAAASSDSDPMVEAERAGHDAQLRSLRAAQEAREAQGTVRNLVPGVSGASGRGFVLRIPSVPGLSAASALQHLHQHRVAEALWVDSRGPRSQQVQQVQVQQRLCSWAWAPNGANGTVPGQLAIHPQAVPLPVPSSPSNVSSVSDTDSLSSSYTSSSSSSTDSQSP